MRHAARRDLNDAEIVAAVKAAGFAVIDYTKAGLGIPDKLVTRILPQMSDDGFPVYFVCWLEIKSDKGKLSERQLLARNIWEPRGEWLEARTAAETVKELDERYQAKIKPECSR